MQSPETAIPDPRLIYPPMPREGTVERLKVAAHEADQNALRMSRRGRPADAKYYGGRRDGLLLAIEMLENE